LHVFTATIILQNVELTWSSKHDLAYRGSFLTHTRKLGCN